MPPLGCVSLSATGKTLSDGGRAPNFVNISKWCFRVSHRVVTSVSRKPEPSENTLVCNLALRCWQ